jgi:hypothetical protein
MSVEAARAVADAVLYEGYLLYPYRASAAKNRSRWQFGVLGPPAAASAAFAEGPAMAMSCLLSPSVRPGTVTLHLRFLHLQSREVERRRPDGSYEPVAALEVAGETLLSWDEAVEQTITFERLPLIGEASFPVAVPGGTEVEQFGDTTAEPLADGSAEERTEDDTTREPLGLDPRSDQPNLAGRIIRRRRPLTARLDVAVTPDGDLLRLTVTVTNVHPSPVTDKDSAARHSLLGAHLLIEAHDAVFLSMQDPPESARDAAARCHQHRCWPVLAGSDTVLLAAPIILYDHPAVAPESPGALFDATEIDEILTLRVMTMTEAEKAEARATDPRAADLITRCDTLTPADLQRLHGTRHDSPAASPTDTAQPSANPATTFPAAPSTTAPSATAPSAGAASATAPSTTTPSTTAPSATAPSAGAASATAPYPTPPSTTAHSATARSATATSAGAPAATARSTTAPSPTATSADAPAGTATSADAPSATALSPTVTSAGAPSASAPSASAPSASAPSASAASAGVLAAGDVPWWDPGVDGAVSPETDVVRVGGVEVRKGSLVRLRPRRRADAQDLFFEGQEARVTAVLGDVDGGTHVAVVLVDDPAADLHDWYGRYLYFAPEELEPLAAGKDEQC